MGSAYVYPVLGDRRTPEEWQEQGAADIWARAQERVKELLSEHYPGYIPPVVDRELRNRYPIRLPREAMSSPSARW